MDRPQQSGVIFTIGHSTRPLAEFVALLREAAVALLVDVRSIPRSRANPQYNNDVLPGSLAEFGIDYRHAASLGGRRHRPKGAPPSRNTLWRVAAFQNYADYAATPGFRVGLDELKQTAVTQRCAIMCAEAVWWRCHRRIIADYLLADGVAVRHIMGPGKVEPATPTPGAQPQPDRTVRYEDAGEPPLPLFTK
jgi:uncharacterized protein (DUF488 family)